MKKRIFCILFAIVTVLLSFPVVAAKAEDDTAVIRITAGKLNKYGCFDVTVSIENCKFSSFQIALNFNPNELQPMDSDGKKISNSQNFFQKTENASWLSLIGEDLDSKEGYLTFAGFVTPGAKSDDVQNGEYTAEGSVEVLKFRSKKLTTIKDSLSVANRESGEKYNEALPTGAVLLNLDGEVTGSVIIDFTSVDAEKAIFPISSGENELSVTTAEADKKKERFSEAIILKKSSPYAVTEGKISWIYKSESGISPTDDSNTVLLPVRFIAEKFGAEVIWDGSTKTVLIYYQSQKTILKINSNDFEFNGQIEKTNVNTLLLEDSITGHTRTMAGKDILETALGLYILEDIDSGYIYITKKDDPWDFAGEAEIECQYDISTLFSPLITGFVQN